MGVGEVPEVRLTGSVRAVLKVMVAGRGSRLPVGSIARDARLSATAVRNALSTLGKAGLVQHHLAPGADTRPPRMVYWPTHDGYTVGSALSEDRG